MHPAPAIPRLCPPPPPYHTHHRVLLYLQGCNLCAKGIRQGKRRRRTYTVASRMGSCSPRCRLSPSLSALLGVPELSLWR